MNDSVGGETNVSKRTYSTMDKMKMAMKRNKTIVEIKNPVKSKTSTKYEPSIEDLSQVSNESSGGLKFAKNKLAVLTKNAMSNLKETGKDSQASPTDGSIRTQIKPSTVEGKLSLESKPRSPAQNTSGSRTMTGENSRDNSQHKKVQMAKSGLVPLGQKGSKPRTSMTSKQKIGPSGHTLTRVLEKEEDAVEIDSRSSRRVSKRRAEDIESEITSDSAQDNFTDKKSHFNADTISRNTFKKGSRQQT